MKTFNLLILFVVFLLYGCEKENIIPPRLVCCDDWLTNSFYHTLPEIIDSAGLYKRPSYKLSQSDSSLYLCCKSVENVYEGGWWKLIEIADCSSGKVYYPCARDPYEQSYIGFDPEKHLDMNQSEPDRYPYENFCIAITGNSSTFTYKYLNDSTIITSQGGTTQAGVSPEAWSFWIMYTNLLQNSTLIIKKNKNLLELKTADNVFLRFYK